MKNKLFIFSKNWPIKDASAGIINNNYYFSNYKNNWNNKIIHKYWF